MTQATLEKENQKEQYSPDDMSQFLSEIRQYPLLTQEEELELAKKCALGDADAIRTMVNSNLRLVVSLAKDYVGRGVPLLDLIQEGSIGLLSAAKNVDYTQQCRFSYYATWWIQQSMDRCVLNHGGVIRVPLHTMEKIRKLLAIRNALRQENGDEPTIEDIAARADIQVDKAAELLALFPQVGSLDVLTGEDSTLQQLLEDPFAPEPYEELVKAELSHTLNKLLSLLPERQSLVLRLHFGLEDGQGMSLEQIGKLLGISKQRARQIERQAIEKLQKLGTDLGLEEFLE